MDPNIDTAQSRLAYIAARLHARHPDGTIHPAGACGRAMTTQGMIAELRLWKSLGVWAVAILDQQAQREHERAVAPPPTRRWQDVTAGELAKARDDKDVTAAAKFHTDMIRAQATRLAEQDPSEAA